MIRRMTFPVLILMVGLLSSCATVRPNYDGYTARDGFDPERADFSGPDMFQRFEVPDEGELLRDVGLNGDDVIIIVERKGERRALLVKQLAYHHLAQGELAGEPYLVSF